MKKHLDLARLADGFLCHPGEWLYLRCGMFSFGVLGLVARTRALGTRDWINTASFDCVFAHPAL